MYREILHFGCTNEIFELAKINLSYLLYRLNQNNMELVKILTNSIFLLGSLYANRN